MPVSEADDFDRELEGYEEVATDFGTKIDWTTGVAFSGIFDGFRDIKYQGEMIEAGTFHDDDDSYWCWLPFQLENALRNTEVGSQVVIVCNGEDEDAPHRKGGNKQWAFTVRRKG
jgi:hypothetical protein